MYLNSKNNDKFPHLLVSDDDLPPFDKDTIPTRELLLKELDQERILHFLQNRRAPPIFAYISLTHAKIPSDIASIMIETEAILNYPPLAGEIAMRTDLHDGKTEHSAWLRFVENAMNDIDLSTLNGLVYNPSFHPIPKFAKVIVKHGGDISPLIDSKDPVIKLYRRDDFHITPKILSQALRDAENKGGRATPDRSFAAGMALTRYTGTYSKSHIDKGTKLVKNESNTDIASGFLFNKNAPVPKKIRDAILDDSNIVRMCITIPGWLENSPYPPNDDEIEKIRTFAISPKANDAPQSVIENIFRGLAKIDGDRLKKRSIRHATKPQRNKTSV